MVRQMAAPGWCHNRQRGGPSQWSVQWESHQISHPNIAHSPRLNTAARIHGLGDEKRITLLGLAVSTFEPGLRVSTSKCGGR
jgi:hypothetical protein